MAVRSIRPAAEERPRRVVIVGFAGAQILDVTGPLEVFASAHRHAARAPGKRPRRLYDVDLAAREAGAFPTSSGVELTAQRALRDVRGPIDTLVVAGGVGTVEALRDRRILRFIERVAPRARRVASVCTGAFLLAEVGLLDGRRATTHWSACERLASDYPRVEVDPDPIFVRDGSVYTSAGVTAGMDLALALVEEDHGRAVALGVARGLVLFLKRPGGQSQFSVQLDAQATASDPIRDLQSWILANPGEDLSVFALAARVAMSPRNFARVFQRETGITPARFVERSRVESARAALEESDHGVEAIASRCGFGSAETMRRTFLRQLRVSPADYRERFRVRAS